MSLEVPLVTNAELTALQEQVIIQRTLRDVAASSINIGPYRSAHRGHGLELQESRPYRPGDEPRHMDWRATARSGRPMSKVYRAEQQRSVFLVVDRSITMAFATRGDLKARMAARAAAVLAFSAVAAHEPVAGALVTDTLQFFPSSRTAGGVLPLLQACAAAMTSERRQVEHGLRQTQNWEWIERVTPPGATVYVISDLRFLTGDHQNVLGQLSERREIIVLQVLDPSEVTLPAAGALRLYSPISGGTFVIDTSDRRLQAAYAAATAKQLAEQATLLRRSGVTLRRVQTTDDIFTVLGDSA
jgi:uncharacterized protein (DUF58 family)